MNGTNPESLAFSLMFFAASDDALLDSRYELIIESARFADTRGFSSVWVPERHFTDFGCLYPNPAVLHAALARETRNLRLRAGSVVIPIHDPLRIAEEWSMVDNLSAGRVGISAATGWNPNDFAFFPERYAERKELMYRGLDTVRSLWRGERLTIRNGVGKSADVQIYPKPVQPELPVWLTAAGSPETFIRAGELGLNVLTHLLDHDVDDIAERIALYRAARAEHGWDPEAGQVTIMLHTFVGPDDTSVREAVRGPYTQWLSSNAALLKGLAANRGAKVDVDALSPADKQEFANFLFERFYTSRSLMGEPRQCLQLLNRLAGVGVTEVACLLDFGPRAELILEHLPYLERLLRLYRSEGRPEASDSAERGIRARAELRARAQPRALKEAERTDDLQAARTRCREELNSEEFYDRLGRSGAQFGPEFRGVQRLWRGDGEALAEVCLVPGAADEDRSFIYPPYLDACLQAFAAALPDNLSSSNANALYLPVGLQSFKQHRPPPPRVFSHARLRPAVGEHPELLEGDLRVLDDAGVLVCEVHGFRLQRTVLDGSSEDPVAQWFYEVAWRPLELANETPSEPGTWLIFSDRQGVGDALAKTLEARGDRCLSVYSRAARAPTDPGVLQVEAGAADEIRRTVDAGCAEASRLKGVVHLWSLDVPAGTQLDALMLQEAQAAGIETVLHIVQALLKQPSRNDRPRLWMATRGARAVPQASDELSPAQSVLWGFATTLATEHPELLGAIVDLDASPAPESARQILKVLHTSSDEQALAFRADQCWVPRLSSTAETPRRVEASRFANGTYLITGGFGGVGLETAHFLVEHGARHLVLVGRRVPAHMATSSAQSSALAESDRRFEALLARGVHIHCAAADVTDESALRSIIHEIEQRAWPTLKGVVHAAGIAHAEKLVSLTPEGMREVLHPKVSGAWALHRAVSGRDLDFFVLYSSATHQLGVLGQSVAAYSAANAFLDGLAEFRRSQGEHALSVCWGPWSRVGMAARSGNDQRLQGFGIEGIDPASGVRALAHLLLGSRAVAWAIPVNWTAFFAADTDAKAAPLLRELVTKLDGSESDELVARRAELLGTLRRAPAKQRQNLLFQHVQGQAMDVMRLDTSDAVDWRRGLFDLGMDSLMALELKNRLQTSLGLSIPSTLAFSYPDLHSMSSYLVGQLFPNTDEAASEPDAPGAVERSVSAAASQIQGLTEAELESLLIERMEDL